MTDYRFVSAPEVVLVWREWSGGYVWTDAAETVEYFSDDIEFFHDNGIIEPVPVEIPEHVVEAAYEAFLVADSWSRNGIRAALIAAKQAEEAGE